MHALQGKSENKRPLGTMQVNSSHQVEGVLSLTFHQESRNLSYKTSPHTYSTLFPQSMATEHTNAIYFHHSRRKHSNKTTDSHWLETTVQ
eukprot:3632870-Ditylum_brightwellii.AAC.1